MDHLVKSISIENLIAQRNAVASKIRDAAESLAAAAELSEEINAQIEHSCSMGSHQTIDVNAACFDRYDHHHHLCREGGADKAVSKIDASLWDLLLKESGLLTLMDAESREKWDTQIREHKHPALTKENVSATFAALMEARGEMFEQGVLEIFRKLSWDYKSNNPVKFGKKIIRDFACDGRWGGGLNLEYKFKNELADIERVFSVVDGKPERDHRRQFPDHVERGDLVPFPYFDVRCFKKGSGHVIFTRPDLVDALNKIVAKHHPNALPPRS